MFLKMVIAVTRKGEPMNDLIEKLSSLRSQFNCFNENEREAYHALSDAIKAISDRPEPCEDAVSRQAVLDLIADYDLSMGELVNCTHALPPVTPKRKKGKYHDPFGNPIYVYVRVGDKTVAIKADDLQKALDYVTEHGEEVTIEGRRE